MTERRENAAQVCGGLGSSSPSVWPSPHHSVRERGLRWARSSAVAAGCTYARATYAAQQHFKAGLEAWARWYADWSVLTVRALRAVGIALALAELCVRPRAGPLEEATNWEKELLGLAA